MRKGRPLDGIEFTRKLALALAISALAAACAGGAACSGSDEPCRSDQLDRSAEDGSVVPADAADDKRGSEVDGSLHTKDQASPEDTGGTIDLAEPTEDVPAPTDLAGDTGVKPEETVATPDEQTAPDVEEVESCHSCHTPLNEIYSQVLGRNLALIDWVAGDVHGANPATGLEPDKGYLNAPFNDGAGAPWTLKCQDCHVPHGTTADPANPYSLASSVNGVTLGASVKVNDNSNGAWTALCGACHTVTQTGPGYPCGAGGHGPGPNWSTRPCFDCHGHQKFICGPGNWSF